VGRKGATKAKLGGETTPLLYNNTIFVDTTLEWGFAFKEELWYIYLTLAIDRTGIGNT